MLDNFFKKIKDKDKRQDSSKGTSLDEASVENWRPGDIILDRYRIDNVFSGAMGRVYIAEHLGWKVPMAIKAPKPEVLANREGMQRILTEANSWVKMGMHPNVATCYYALDIDNTPYLFIEYVDGGDLSSWIKSGRCRDLRTILSMAIQFCHGMEFTHSKGIIHRDIKPGNILLTKNALLKITDFGIIQTAGEKRENGALKQEEGETTVGFRGTPSYASPEQFRDSHNIDKRSDIFSFGICLWLMFCGFRPFKNNAQPGKPEPIPKDSKIKFPSTLNHLLKKSVEFEPADRFQDFAELRQHLNEAHITLFKAPCPYMELDFSDLQAENLNNRAVSLLELGKQEEGEKCIQKSLDINDGLQEAIFNYTLLKWKKGASSDLLVKQLEATQKRHPEAKMLETLTQAVKCDLYKSMWEDEDEDDEEDIDQENSPPSKPQIHYPEYLLCLPKNSLGIFQSAQLLKSAKANITDLLKKREFESCTEVLFNVWGNNGFRKDNLFIKIYEELLKVGKKGKLKEVIRYKSIRNTSLPAQNLLCLPKSTQIFSLCTDGKIQVVNYGKSGKVRSLGKYKSIKTAVLSPDVSYLALGFENGKIEIVPLKPKLQKKSFTTNSTITALSFPPGNESIAVGDSNGQIKFFPIKKGKEIVFDASKDGAITSLINLKKGDNFVSGSENGTLRYWHQDEKDPIRITKAHSKAISILSAAPNGLFYISGSADRLTKLWNRQTGQCMRTTMAHDDLMTSAMVMPDCRYYITTGNDDLIKIWDISTGESSLVLDGRGGGITSLTQGPRPHIFITGSQDGSIIIWIAIYDLEFS